ncbi:uncharacterized protein LOC134247828 isoform X2 [Saccostrea cucullata]|uniref:uncharacterized protein LOC134247828 isoform X2 n=1 Tax=Saccostrea cuccullata TaxID=36930 RepID=UPI002ED67A37
MKAWIFVIFSLLTSFVSQVNGGYDVSVKLLEYYRDPDNCCDTVIGCAGECDVYFQICLKPLQPKQYQKCYGKNNNQRVENTNRFLFADSLKSADFYTWKDIRGQPSFDISVHVFDHDDLSSDDKIGVTTYEYRDYTTKKLTVTTTPGSRKLRIKLLLDISSGQENVNTPIQKWLHLVVAMSAASLFCH